MEYIEYRVYVNGTMLCGKDIEKNSLLDGFSLFSRTSNGFLGMKIMQFIGIHDKVGKKIFVGDIIENDNGIRGEVFFDMNELQYRMKRDDGDIENFSWYIGNEYNKLTIIGNIYNK